MSQSTLKKIFFTIVGVRTKRVLCEIFFFFQHDLEVTAGDRYHLKVTFPSPVDDGACKSAFNPKTSLLTVSTPCEA